MRRFLRRHFFRFCCAAAMVAPTPGMRTFFNRLKGCRIGKHTWIGSQVFLDVHLDHPDPGNAIVIGQHVSIGQNVLAFTHDSSYWQVTGRRRPIEFGRVVIGDYTYVGPGALIYDSRIGDHCIVMAHSVLIKKEYPSHSLIAGYPARVIKNLEDEVGRDRDSL
jgi:acetyltransferase-like isoleucine patch superfamily enzyme